jgi:hypothetical protein
LLTIYRDEGGSVRQSTSLDLPHGVIWMDLLNPTEEEKAFVESRARIQVPSRDALSEIEASSRLHVERGVLYLSTPVLAHADSVDAHLSPAGFVLSPSLLVTVRYADLATFSAVADQIRADETLASGIGVFTALLEAIVDRGADELEPSALSSTEPPGPCFGATRASRAIPCGRPLCCERRSVQSAPSGTGFRSRAMSCSASAESRPSRASSVRNGSALNCGSASRP